MVIRSGGGLRCPQERPHIGVGTAATGFRQVVVIDCDASGSGFGAVLHQGVGPLTFFSRAIAPHHAKLAAYERELIGLVKAVRH
jgi:hypothetical protein